MKKFNSLSKTLNGLVEAAKRSGEIKGEINMAFKSMQDKDGGYCPRCDTVWASPGKCRCEENNKVFKGQLGKFNTEPKEYSKEVIEKYNDAADVGEQEHLK